MTWQSETPPPNDPIPASAWPRIGLRAMALVFVFAVGLAVHALVRLAEYPHARARRPLSGRVVQAVCWLTLRILGLPVHVTGRPLRGAGALVCNHSSWLDILALHAITPVTFVSKAEVAGWPGIGLLARVAGTLFIRRDRREARAQTALFGARLRARQRLLFFPEGTSSDGQRLLPFKPTLFQALLDPALGPDLRLQPVSLTYHAPQERDPRFYGWWGDMDFGAHALQVLAQARQGRAEIVFHDSIDVAAQPGRKALAAAAEAAVRAGLTTAENPC